MSFSCTDKKAAEEAARLDSLRLDSLKQDSVAKAVAQAQADSIAKAKADSAARDKEAIDFITDMYNEHKYEDDNFLRKHCTAKVIKKLEADFEYEGGGLASWDFRSGAQDGPSNRYGIVSVTPKGGGWYDYSYYDMGTKGLNSIKLIWTDGEIMIDGIKQR